MAPTVDEGVAGTGLTGAANDTLPLNLAIVDAEGTVLSTNDAWQEFAESNGFEARPDTLGENYLEIADAADDPYAARAAAGIRAVLGGERERFELEYPCHSPDEERWFLMRATPFTHDGERYGTVAHLDITDRKAREQVLREAYEISAASEPSFDRQVDSLLKLVRDALGTEYATLSRVQDGRYVFEAVDAPLEADLRAGETAPLASLPNCERVVDTERTLVLRDVGAEAPELADPEWGIASYLGAPVTVDGEVYGTFCFYSTEPRDEAFSDWAVTLVELLSDWVSHEFERREREEKLHQIRENVTDVVWMSSLATDEIEFISDAYEEVWGRPPETLCEDPRSFVDAIHPDDRDRVREALEEQRHRPDEYEETYRVVRPDGEVRWIHDRSSGVYDDGDLQRIVGIANDVTERVEHERELERQRDELAQLHRLNALVRRILQALQDTSTRDGIETAVCRHLTESELYRAVWIGTRGGTATGEPTVVPRTAAGVDESYLEGIPGGEPGPAEAALRTGEIRVVDDIATAGGVPDERRETALARGHHALAAVPLATGGTTYGVLVVYAPREHTIRDAEQGVLTDLGGSIARAIQRVHSQRSLAARTVVALDLRIPDTGFVFGEASTELDCELSLDRRVSAGDGSTIYYLTVHGAHPGRVCEFLEGSPLVAACTEVGEADEAGSARLEVHIEDTPRLPLDVLTDYGASVTTARAVDGHIDVGVELPPEVEVPTVLDALREVAPAIEIVRKRHVDRPTETLSGIQQRVRSRLTRKQEAALEAAYARGYYEWPRDSTMEELAEVFDVSGPALHYRLRRAHRTVMSVLLDGEGAPEDTKSA
jgi:PAS domain S-box-containing protein